MCVTCWDIECEAHNLLFAAMVGTSHGMGVLPQPNQGMTSTPTGAPFPGVQVGNAGTHGNLHGVHGVNNITVQQAGGSVGQMMVQVVRPGGPAPSDDVPSGTNIGGSYGTMDNSSMVMPPGSVHYLYVCGIC